MLITDYIGGYIMNNNELQNLIEKYKKELIKYADENGGYVKEDIVKKAPEAMPVVSVVSSEDNTNREADITELEGTNPDGYNAGRIEPTYLNVNDFESKNQGKGTLKVQAFSGREAFPIVNARVVVSKDFENGSHIFFDDLTDTSGIVENMMLSSPRKDVAQRDNSILPYSTYSIRVTHPYFITTVYESVPVFDGIASIQPVNMVPRTGTPTDDREIVYTEQEPTDL